MDSATGTAIIAVDLHGRLTVFNPGAEAILGHRAEEVLGRLADEVLDPDDRARQSAELGTNTGFAAACRVLVAGESARRPWRFVRSDGDHRTLHVTITAVPGTDDSVPGYLATGEDVTDRERGARHSCWPSTTARSPCSGFASSTGSGRS